jgi:mRNA interferase MazF
MATYESSDIVVVPFPFTDRKTEKRRPALVLSKKSRFNAPSGHCILSMITSQKNPPWPLDVPISNSRKTGLSAPSKVRMKIFTLDRRLIVRKIGVLPDKDKKAVSKAIKNLFLE